MPHDGTVLVWLVQALLGLVLILGRMWVRDQFTRLQEEIKRQETERRDLIAELNLREAQMRARVHDVRNELTKTRLQVERLMVQSDMRLFPRPQHREEE